MADLLEKTKFVKFLSEKEAIVQLRYLHWILKGVLKINEDYIVDANSPPSVLFQGEDLKLFISCANFWIFLKEVILAEKTFCEFPNEKISATSWDKFMASRSTQSRNYPG